MPHNVLLSDEQGLADIVQAARKVKANVGELASAAEQVSS